MTFTLKQIANIYIVFNNLSNGSYPVQFSYWVIKNLHILQETYQFFIQQRDALYQEYLQLNENNSYATPLGDGTFQFQLKNVNQAEEFSNKFDEIFNMECEIEPYYIKLDTLMDMDVNITPYQLDILKDFILE